ncbi:Tat pathway signal sequence domain protein [Streptomyces sp. YS415]|uniref:Tat pathway signal sequence domain protein n=1 Tax=Streptomyces sp. YS415 TaxID=2944806 RepID=UPI0020213CC3|nr:Tat pathway signal sequence domain protein [Streptomyces sp. YS415]MCL7423818.1 Tat pathway signal sequence domain protein [Streptomyces sp. YS415]
MSGVGPVEPGEGTHVQQPSPAPQFTPQRDSPAPLGRLLGEHRRAAVAAGVAAALLAGGGYLYATRPQPPPAAAPPYPSQVVDIRYLSETVSRDSAEAAAFRFDITLSVLSGPPVTVTAITQPYAGLFVTASPAPPFRTEAGSSRKVTITLRATDCGKIPGNAGLPFLDVTLRNTRAIQTHSFILGSRYALDLSHALRAACGAI